MPFDLPRVKKHHAEWLLQVFLLLVLLMSPGMQPATAQPSLSAEEARTIEFGKEIFKNKAQCQFCHKWDGGGDQGYGGIALSLRKTQLTPEQLTEAVKC